MQYDVYAEFSSREEVDRMIGELCWWPERFPEGLVRGCDYDNQGPYYNPLVVKVCVQTINSKVINKLGKRIDAKRITHNGVEIYPNGV